MSEHSECIKSIIQSQLALRAQLASVAETLRGSREQSVAMTKMDEARMWLHAAEELIKLGDEPSDGAANG